MQALFDSVGISDLAANIQFVLVSFISIALLFVGYRMVRKSLLDDNSPGVSSGYRDNGWRENSTMQSRRTERRAMRRYRRSH